MFNYSLFPISSSNKSMVVNISDFCEAVIMKHIAAKVIDEVKNMEYAYSKNVLAS